MSKPQERWTLNHKRLSITERLPGGASAEYSVTPRREDGELIVTEVRIRRPGGVTARNCRVSPPEALEEFAKLVHSLQSSAELGEAIKAMERKLRQQGASSEEVLRLAFGTHPAEVARMQRDQRLATVAAGYVRARAEGSPRPNEIVAQRLGRTTSQVRDDLTAARHGGFLTRPPGQGSPGGALTEKAMGILRTLNEGATE
jgi:hypothetical protein